MAKKFWTINNLRKILKPIGYATIGGLGVFFFTLRLDAKDDVIKEKETIIERLKVFEYSNVSAEIEALKNIYQSQIEMYKMKIKALESDSGNVKQIEVYRKKVTELESKLNLITQVSDDFTKKMLARLGKELKFDEVKPFAFFALFDKKDSEVASFNALYENWYYNFKVHVRVVVSIPPPKPGDCPCPFIKTGTHSPLFYSFDNVDLRTATFKRADLRGVDLSDAQMDVNTKLPVIK